MANSAKTILATRNPVVCGVMRRFWLSIFDFGQAAAALSMLI
jgi:hypothetical protein